MPARHTIGRWLVLLPLCLLAACEQAFFSDQVVGHLDHAPNAVVILGNESTLPQWEMAAFHDAMRTALQHCGITAAVVSFDPLTLDPAADRARFLAMRRKIHADMVITYRETSSTTGNLPVANFAAVAVDAHNAAVWRGQFFMPKWNWTLPTADPGVYTGQNLIDRLAHDGLLGACKPPAS